MSVLIQPLEPADVTEAARALARAFVTNPLHVAAFGEGKLRASEEFFRVGLGAMRGSKFVAREGSRILGAVHWVRTPGCRFSGGQKLSMMPALISALGFGPAMKLRKWLTAWEKIHPVEHHLHLGPIGVSPEAQRRHIGQDFMEMFCDEADRGSIVGYLETDRAENTVFYERFGFETFQAYPVLGVPNYFMKRKPRRREKKGWQEI